MAQIHGVVVGEGRFARDPRHRIQPIRGPRCSHAAWRSDGGGIAAIAWFEGALSKPLSTAVTW